MHCHTRPPCPTGKFALQQGQGNPVTTRRVTPLVPVTAAISQQPQCQRNIRVQAWTQVIDQATGKPYYWNTATNETAWEIPATTSDSSTPEASTSSSGSSSSGIDDDSQQQPTMSNDALFDVLAAAYSADGSGMEFWEVARAHRKHGVFDPPFFEYLEQRQQAAADGTGAELAFKMMCRLSNPLLRQPAPFE